MINKNPLKDPIFWFLLAFGLWGISLMIIDIFELKF